MRNSQRAVLPNLNPSSSPRKSYKVLTKEISNSSKKARILSISRQFPFKKVRPRKLREMKKIKKRSKNSCSQFQPWPIRGGYRFRYKKKSNLRYKATAAICLEISKLRGQVE